MGVSSDHAVVCVGRLAELTLRPVTYDSRHCAETGNGGGRAATDDAFDLNRVKYLWDLFYVEPLGRCSAQEKQQNCVARRYSCEVG